MTTSPNNTFAGDPPTFQQVGEGIVMGALRHGPSPVNAVRVRVVRYNHHTEGGESFDKFRAEFSVDSLTWFSIDPNGRNIEDDAIAIAQRFLSAANPPNPLVAGRVVWRSE